MIILQLLQELKELQTPALRYWGGEKIQVYHTRVFLEMISNDLPETCSNTCTTFNGAFTHRWRHSCKFDDNIVHACPSCDLNNIQKILTNSSMNQEQIKSCGECSDWWSHDVTKPSVYPIHPKVFDNEINTFPSVELSFLMIKYQLYLSKTGAVLSIAQKQ